jgi:hypothetical protein
MEITSEIMGSAANFIIANPSLSLVMGLCVAFAISALVHKRRALKYEREYHAVCYEPQEQNARREWYKQNAITDEDNQIAAVSDYHGFKCKRIFNREEAEVFYIIKDILLRDATFARWHVHGQVSLGEIIRTDVRDAGNSRATRAYRSINSKRVDMAVVDNRGMPVAIIEYNGYGHHGDDPERAKKRDQVKVIVAKKAGIKLIELLPEMDRRTKEQLILKAFAEYQMKRRSFENAKPL